MKNTPTPKTPPPELGLNYIIIMNNMNLTNLVSAFAASITNLNNHEKATLSRTFVRELCEGKAGAYSMQEVEVRGYGQNRREVLHDVEYKLERKSYTFRGEECFYDVRRIVGSWGWGSGHRRYRGGVG